MNRYKYSFGLIFCLSFSFLLEGFGQCGVNVPHFNADLSGHPDSLWFSPSVSRADNCCTSTSPDNCISMDVTLDPNAVGIIFDIYSGAVPPGALYYQINCGPLYQVGQAICLNGTGPFHLTFCKPGNNQNVYSIQSVRGPLASNDLDLYHACSGIIYATGFKDTSLRWNSISPGGLGTFNSALSCTVGCDSVYVAYDANLPPDIYYQVCGTPTAVCGSLNVCDTVRVSFHSNLVTSITPHNPILCYPDSTIQITANVTNGDPPYQFLWNTGAVGQSIIATQGIYSVQVLDSRACSYVRDTISVVRIAAPVAAHLPGDFDTCYTTPSISLAGTFTGGSSIVWSGGTSSVSPNNTSANVIYNFTASDRNNGFVDLILHPIQTISSCPYTDDTVHIALSTFTGINNPVVNQVTCTGYNNGSVQLNMSLGYPQYLYSWNTGSALTSIQNLAPGLYNVTVTDNNKCTSLYNYTITQPPPLSLIGTPADAICFGAGNGSISLNVSGGTPNYSYQWSNSATGQSNNNLYTGSYSVTVQDQNACSITGAYNVSQPTQLVLGPVTLQNVTCFGAANGTLSANPSGGTPPYSYQWSNGAFTQGNGNLSAGVYSVTVRDQHLCSVTAAYTISQPALLILNAANIQNLNCFNSGGGSISLNPTGGTFPLSYQWSNGATGSNISSLSAGSYNVTVRDLNLCSVTASYLVTQPALLAINPATIQNISCYNANNGSLSISPSGGVAPYNYQWSNGGMGNSLANLFSGSYSVTIYDQNLCSASSSYNLSQPAQLTLGAPVVQNAQCFGGTEGSLISNPSGGTTPYSYQWNNGPVTQGISNLAAGNYTVTVRDQNLCSITAIYAVVQPLPIQLHPSTQNVICYSGSSGSVTLNPSGGVPGYTYQWSNGSANAGIFNIAAGIYYVTVTDQSLCFSTAQYNISQPGLLQLNPPTAQNVSCYNGSNASVTANVSGGTMPYTYHWSNGGSGPAITGVTAGTYTLTVYDQPLCSVTSSYTLTAPAQLSVTAVIQNALCNNGSSGSITASATGGTGQLSYNWNTGASIAAITNISTGTYSVTVTDQNFCTVSSSFAVTHPTPLLINNPVLQNPGCFNGANGSISITPAGASPGYTYSWSNGASSQGISGLASGNYSVTVRDANLCSASASYLLSQPQVLTANASVIQQVICYGGNNGTIAANPAGGTAPYSYQWSNGLSSQVISNLSSGIYGLSIYDQNFCSVAASYTVTQPGLLQLNAPVSQDVTCYNGTNGSISLNPSGGVPTYSYQWSNGTTNQNNSNLTTGTYSVTVRDQNLCSVTGTFSIAQAAQLVMNAAVIQNVSCYNGGNGSVAVNPSGGTIPYAYQWNNGAASSVNNNVVAGIYTVTVSDQNLCTTSASYTITQPLQLQIGTFSIQHITCFNGNNGNISINASGGTPSYTYQWSNGSSVPGIFNLGPASYSITVSDQHLCSVSAAYTITQPSLLSIASVSIQTTSCFGGANGSVAISVAGGVPGYAYQWSNGTTAQNVSNLSSGLYNVTLTDQNLCSLSSSYSVSQPSQFAILSGTVQDVVCNSGTGGSISIVTSGGTTPYAYQWSNGAISQNIGSLAAGTYSVTAQDQNLCSVSAAFNVSQPAAVILNAPAIQNVNCFGSSNGTITANPSGGIFPYTFLWNNGLTSQSITGLAAGTHSVTLSDINLCSASASYSVIQPLQMSMSPVVQNVSCFGGNDGSIAITVSGGNLPYAYQWSNGNAVQLNSGLSAGNYSLTVFDNNFCSLSAAYPVSQATQLTLSAASIQNASCYGISDGRITVNPVGGTLPYNYQWNNSGITQTVTNLSSGAYTVTASDQHACTVTAAYVIAQPTQIVFGAPVIQQALCYNGAGGSITINPTGGTPAFVYQWSNGLSTPAISNLTAGTYSVVVQDQNLCSASSSFSITQPVQLTISANVQSVSCFNAANGSIALNVSGGTFPFTYLWTNGTTGQNLNNLQSGNYGVTVSDQNGCSASAGYFISQPVQLALGAPSIQSVSCYGLGDGSITVNPVAGTSPYNYQWNNGNGTQTAGTLVAGNYMVTVYDVNLCSTTGTYNIVQPTQLILSAAGIQDALCYNQGSGRITVNPSGGTFPYTYQWSNGASGQTNSNLTSGNYQVTILDQHQCSITSAYAVAQPSQLILNTAAIQDAACYNSGNGSISLNPSGGTPAYNYQWNNGAGSQVINNLSSGTYSVTVFDLNLCSVSGLYNISQPNPLILLPGTVRNITCFGSNNGSVLLSPTGGTLPFTYQWSNGATGSFIGNLSGGNYTISITDQNLCSASAGFLIMEPSPLAISSSAVQHVSCNNGSNGSISLTVAGGTLPYAYQWNNGASTANINGLAAGNYQVVISDLNLCSVSASRVITQPTMLQISSSTLNAVGCYGIANGSITINPAGGITPYTFQWSNGSSSQNQGGLGAGTYAVNVFDQNQCSVSSSFIISQPSQFVINPATVQNITCFGSNNGSITLNPMGGTFPYTFQWNNGGTGMGISNLSTGTYSVTASDMQSCSVSGTYSITQPGALTINQAGIQNVNCNNGNNGSISVTVSGGALPFVYQWSNGGTASALSALYAGNYNLLVYDLNLCSATASYSLTQPPVLAINTPAIQNPVCFGVPSGNISANVSGGTSPYYYNWSNGGVSQAAGNLPGGNYSLTVTDQHLCSATAIYALTQPAQMQFNAFIQNESCFGASNANITLNPYGGNPGYLYNWNTGATSISVTNLLPGTYLVTMTDQSSCSVASAFTVTQPAMLLISAPVLQNSTCFSGSNGAITANPSGGTTPYSYQWSNGAITQTISGLSGGNYLVTVLDQHICSATASYTITQPSQLSIDVSSTLIQNTSCFNGNDGSVSITATGGLPPYSYQWSNGAVSQNIANVYAGNYSVTVLDNGHCSTTGSYDISQPVQMVFGNPISQAVHCFQGNDGSLGVNVSGGSPLYVYHWSNGASSSAINSLQAGTYSVTVRDQNQCTVSVVYTLYQPQQVQVTASPVSETCVGAADGTIQTSVTGGSPPYNFNLLLNSSLVQNNSTGFFGSLASAAYNIVTTDNFGCPDSTQTIVPAATPDNYFVQLDSIRCAGDQSGSIFISSSNLQNSPHTYSLDNGDTNVSGVFTNLSPGAYNVTIRNVHGCDTSFAVNLREPPAAFLEIVPHLDTINLGESVQLRYIFGPFDSSSIVSYDWQPHEGLDCYDCPNPTPRNYQLENNYNLTVQYNNGCEVKAWAVIYVNSQYTVYIPNAFTPDGDGRDDDFRIYGNKSTWKQIDFKIFNRLGEKVFESTDINFSWDGTYKGVPQMPAVFVYYAKVRYLDEHDDQYKGSITLIK